MQTRLAGGENLRKSQRFVRESSRAMEGRSSESETEEL